MHFAIGIRTRTESETHSTLRLADQCVFHECRVARFLESRGEVSKALEVARDPDYRFELAVSMHNFEVAREIAEQLGSEQRWKHLGDMALADGQLSLAQLCVDKSSDLSGQMLMFTALGNRGQLQVFASSVPMFMSVH
jgi:hypothetical protein